MADFDPPFSGDNPEGTRLPTASERLNGFQCGPADRTLFNGLFNRLESEVGEVIRFAGIEQTDDRFTQLREAIQAIIASVVNTGDDADYVLMSQARTRLPFFPEVNNTTNTISVIPLGASGAVRLPGGTEFLHRGIFPIVTTETDFATAPSSVYHLRWSPAGGYELFNLSDVTYNPGALAEDSSVFDSSYDDMLIARVISNSSNVVSITNLKNANRLGSSGGFQYTGALAMDGSGIVQCPFSATYNWSRAPLHRYLLPLVGATQTNHDGLDGFANRVTNFVTTRYGATANIASDFSVPANPTNFYANAQWSFMA